MSSLGNVSGFETRAYTLALERPASKSQDVEPASPPLKIAETSKPDTLAHDGASGPAPYVAIPFALPREPFVPATTGEPPTDVSVHGFRTMTENDRLNATMGLGTSLYDSYAGAHAVARIPDAGNAPDAMATETAGGAVPTSLEALPRPHGGRGAAGQSEVAALPYGFDATRVQQLVDGILNERAGLATMRAARQAGDLTQSLDFGASDAPAGVDAAMPANAGM